MKTELMRQIKSVPWHAYVWHEDDEFCPNCINCVSCYAQYVEDAERGNDDRR